MWYRDFAVLEGFLLVKFKRKNTNLAVVILVPLSRQRVNWFRTVGTGVTPKYCVWTSRVSENCAPGICEHVSAPNVQGRLRYCFYSTHVHMFMFGASNTQIPHICWCWCSDFLVYDQATQNATWSELQIFETFNFWSFLTSLTGVGRLCFRFKSYDNCVQKKCFWVEFVFEECMFEWWTIFRFNIALPALTLVVLNQEVTKIYSCWTANIFRYPCSTQISLYAKCLKSTVEVINLVVLQEE